MKKTKPDKLRDELLQKYKALPDEARKIVNERMGEIVETKSQFARDAEPFIVQIAVENLANQRNLAIIAGSLATVSILLFENLIVGPYLWLFSLSIVCLLITTLFAVVGSLADVERGSKTLQQKIDEANAPSNKQLQTLQQLILQEISHIEANEQDAAVKDKMLKHLLRPRDSKWRKPPVWQLVSHVFFILSLSLLAFFFLLRFVPLGWLEHLITTALYASN